MADDGITEGEWDRPTDDDAAIAQLLEGLEAWGAPGPAIARSDPPGPEELVAVLLDIGDLSAGAPTLVRGLCGVDDGRSIFEQERRRLEIPRDRVSLRGIPLARFWAAGGSAAVAVAPYLCDVPRSPVHMRALVLIVALRGPAL